MVCNTFPNRGKSLTPESRIEILDDRSAFVDRNDDTQEAKGFAIMRFLVPVQLPVACATDDVVFIVTLAEQQAHLAKTKMCPGLTPI